MNIYLFLKNAAERFPDKTAVICDGRRMSYGELLFRTDRLAAALRRLGVCRDERAALLCRNKIETVEIIFALLKIGAVCVPLNWRLAPAELEALCGHARPAILFFDGDTQPAVPACGQSIKHFIATCSGPEAGGLSTGALLETAQEDVEAEACSGDKPASIIYTSGTTGRPRGVVLTHGNHYWNTRNYTAAYRMAAEDIELAPTPLFHASTLGRLFTYVHSGITFVLCSRFSPESALEIIEAEQVTAITQAPTMYHMMLGAFRLAPRNTGSVTRAVTGASPMGAGGRAGMAELFPNAALYDLYGLTEAAPGVSITGPPEFSRRPDSVGRPLGAVEVMIADDRDRPVAAGGIGEVLCRGPNVMQGYYRDSRATAKALRGGWLHTGDLGRMDPDGFLYLVGRKNELIISGGSNIYPGEVEAVLGRHPRVEAAAVFGMPDEVWGEKVVAAVVSGAGEACSADSILSFCRRHLAGYKCPREIVFVSELPRNAAQKVLKAVLKEQYRF